ncbi:gluconolactonase [Saccharopolyspora erythraea NRRL 2338]|nr:gluconolactonase [Saccharopolyspora erythraea NRRL 2338]
MSAFPVVRLEAPGDDRNPSSPGSAGRAGEESARKRWPGGTGACALSEFIEARFEVLDERFSGVGGDGLVERLHSGCRWTEGPVYFAAGRYLLFSDIPNDRLLRWDETTGVVGVFRAPAGYTNGHTVDRQGRLVSCEQGHRRVTRTEHDGSVVVLADRWNGKRLNSPNDVVERADGSVWFTDPSYGIDSDYEGHRAETEIGACHVYRVDPATGDVRAVAQDFDRPNGLAFSADERRLYVADTRRKHIRLFDVADDGALSGGEVFATCDAGSFDGVRLDALGRVWAAAHDGVHCFDADGTPLGKLLLPEVVSNLVFGGPKRNHLFMTASSSVYALRVNFNGVAYPR